MRKKRGREGKGEKRGGGEKGNKGEERGVPRPSYGDDRKRIDYHRWVNLTFVLL